MNLGRGLYLANLEPLAFDGDRIVGGGEIVREIAEDGSVLQKGRESLCIGNVVDGDELNVLVVERGAHDGANDAAEGVDTNLDGHYFLRWSVRNCGCAGASDGRE